MVFWTFWNLDNCLIFFSYSWAMKKKCLGSAQCLKISKEIKFNFIHILERVWMPVEIILQITKCHKVTLASVFWPFLNTAALHNREISQVFHMAIRHSWPKKVPIKSAKKWVKVCVLPLLPLAADGRWAENGKSISQSHEFSGWSRHFPPQWCWNTCLNEVMSSPWVISRRLLNLERITPHTDSFFRYSHLDIFDKSWLVLPNFMRDFSDRILILTPASRIKK